jgi:hypothetical protein
MTMDELIAKIAARNPLQVDGPAAAEFKCGPDGHMEPYRTMVTGAVKLEGDRKRTAQTIEAALWDFWSGWCGTVSPGDQIVWRKRPMLEIAEDGRYFVRARYAVGTLAR